MTTTLAKRGGVHKRGLAAVHGTARWVGLFEPSLLDFGAALLRIATPGQAAEYWVGRVRDEVGKVTAYTVRKDGTGRTHAIDVTFGGIAYGVCTCDDAKYCPRRPGGCRHVAALRAALKRVGLV